MLAIPIARPRAAGAASLTSVRHETKPYSKPVRNTPSPAIAIACDDPDPAISPRPKPSTSRPAATDRRAPTRSANKATLPDDINSSAPNPAATRPSPPVDTPWTSSSHAPETMNTLMAVAAVAAEASIGGHAERGRRSRSARGAACTEGGPGATNVHTRPAATSDPHANATYGPRQSNHRISSARIGAPIRSASAQEVSNEPIARLRVANGTRWAIQACPATVRLPTPSTSRTNDTANHGTDPPSAIVDEAATASRPRQKTVRSWPRSSIGPVAP